MMTKIIMDHSLKIKNLAEHCVNYILGEHDSNNCNDKKYNKEIHDQEINTTPADNYDEDYETKSWFNDESYHLMECYLTGNGVKQDFTQSLFWAKIAAKDNWWQSNAWVAWHYFYGRGVNKDINQALIWLNKSVEYAGKKYNVCTSEILKKVIINDQAEWMDKDILRLLNNDR